MQALERTDDGVTLAVERRQALGKHHVMINEIPVWKLPLQPPDLRRCLRPLRDRRGGVAVGELVQQDRPGLLEKG